MTVRERHYENVSELDEVILPARARLLTQAYEYLVVRELDAEEIARRIYTIAVMFFTNDQFTSERALRDAVLHGLHILWLNVGWEYRPLTRILCESWTRHVPSYMIYQEDGVYRIVV